MIDKVGLIYKKLKLRGSKGSRTFNALFDTGASDSFISAKHARLIERPTRLAEPVKLELGKGKISAQHVVVANVRLDGFRLHWTFVVVPGLTEELVIGADFLQRWKIKLDPEKEKIILDPKALKVKLI